MMYPPSVLLFWGHFDDKKKDGFAKEKASDLSEKGPVKPLNKLAFEL